MKEFKWESKDVIYTDDFIGNVLKIPMYSFINPYKAMYQEELYNQDPINYNIAVGRADVLRR